jgi:hypothetical protein
MAVSFLLLTTINGFSSHLNLYMYTYIMVYMYITKYMCIRVYMCIRMYMLQQPLPSDV